jgi:hypothetical protein
MLVVVVEASVDVDDVLVLSKFAVNEVCGINAVAVTWASIFWE